jgi:hypothetical protein
MVEWIAPVKVLANWVSFDWDTLSRGSWFEFLRGIRDDGQYSDVKTSVERFGFRKPLIYAISDEGVYIHGDGHHRFAVFAGAMGLIAKKCRTRQLVFFF